MGHHPWRGRCNSAGIPTGDGMDIESCCNVLIEYNTISAGDDCFTLKAGRGIDGLRVNRPSENIVLRYNLALTGHGGITCGSETAGVIRNVYAHDCVFQARTSVCASRVPADAAVSWKTSTSTG